MWVASVGGCRAASDTGRTELCIPEHHITWSLMMTNARPCSAASILLPRTGGSSNSPFQQHFSLTGCFHCFNWLRSFITILFVESWCHTTSHEAFVCFPRQKPLLHQTCAELNAMRAKSIKSLTCYHSLNHQWWTITRSWPPPNSHYS